MLQIESSAGCTYWLARKDKQTEEHTDEAPDLTGNNEATSSKQKQSADSRKARLDVSGPLREAFGVFGDIHGGMMGGI